MRLHLLTASLLLLLTPVAAGAKPTPSDTMEARITEAEGLVRKRDYIDWNKEQWGEATDAKVGESLREGMQLGTGDKSWAEVKWPHVTARAWSNSSYAIAPNHKLVYLSNGEMLFQLDKHRKDKDSYCIWTNLLQARIRGTTVMVQSTGETSRISVLEGTIDVLNRLEHSVVRLKPGVVYEVTNPKGTPLTQGWIHNETAKVTQLESKPTATRVPSATPERINSIANAATAATAMHESLVGKNEAAATNAANTTLFPNMATTKIAGLPLFETIGGTTSLYLLDVKGVLNEVLGSGFKNPLPSAGLVTQSLNGLLNVEKSPLIATNLLRTNVTTLRVPILSNYKIGQVFSTILPLPETALSHWTPTGWITAPAPANAVNQTLVADGILPGSHFHNSRSVHALPILNSTRDLQSPFSLIQVTSQLPGGTSLPGAVPTANGLLVNNSILVTNGGLTTVPTTLTNINTLATQGLLRTVSTTGGTTLGNVTVATGGLTGTTGLLGGTTTGLLTGVNGLVFGNTGLLGQSGLVVTTLNGVTGTLNGVTGTLNGTVTNLVNPLTTGLTGTVNNTLLQTQLLLNGLGKHL